MPSAPCLLCKLNFAPVAQGIEQRISKLWRSVDFSLYCQQMHTYVPRYVSTSLRDVWRAIRYNRGRKGGVLMREYATPMGLVYGPYGGVGYVGEPSDLSWIAVLLRWLGIRPS